MNDNITKLLEKYIEGKDLDRYKILEDIYCPDAIVSFEIKPDTITFPSEIHGNIEIAKILSADFNQKYDLVKTYYLTDKAVEIGDLQIREQNWLVIMRERASGNIRIGSGYYNWTFDTQNNSELKIKKHKIFIHSMLELPNEAITLLHNLQGKLDYPWVERGKVVTWLHPFSDLSGIYNYLAPIQNAV